MYCKTQSTGLGIVFYSAVRGSLSLVKARVAVIKTKVIRVHVVMYFYTPYMFDCCPCAVCAVVVQSLGTMYVRHQ